MQDMQDCPGRQRNLVPTAGTLPSSEIRQFIGASVPTSRTHKAIRPAAGGQILLAGRFGGKLRLKLPQALGKSRSRHSFILPIVVC
jgi:hypothetical protein